MKITLDRVALKELIDTDPNFELELKAAVISEVGRRFFEKDSVRIIKEADKELFDQALRSFQGEQDILLLVQQALTAYLTKRDSSYYSSVSLSTEARQTLDRYVELGIERVLRDASGKVEAAFTASIQKQLDLKLNDKEIEERIEKRVNRLVDAEIDRRVNEKVAERLAQLSEAMHLAATNVAGA